MNIDAAAVSRMTLVRCHRVGRNIPHFKQPIIVRLNYTNNIEYRRRLFYPIVKKAKQSPKYGKAYIKGDSIVVNNSTDSFDNLHKLPKDLHPKQFSYKKKKEWLIFGGPHSVLNFLSNYFPHKLTYNGIVHDSLEHANQYANAIHFEDAATADKVLYTRSPAIAKQLGSKVVKFDRMTWDCVNGTILMSLLRIKFTNGTEMVTCRSWSIEVICNWYFAEPQEYFRYKQVFSKL